MHNLRNAFKIEPSTSIPISPIPQLQPQTPTDAEIAIKTMLMIRAKILAAIVEKNRF